jgi:hypothetical protein
VIGAMRRSTDKEIDRVQHDAHLWLFLVPRLFDQLDRHLQKPRRGWNRAHAIDAACQCARPLKNIAASVLAFFYPAVDRPVCMANSGIGIRLRLDSSQRLAAVASPSLAPH